MTSRVTIVNLAIIRLGVPKIGAFSDKKKAADIMDTLYDNARDTILRKYPFKFAIQRKVLAKSATTPEYFFAFEYELPTDFVRLLNVEGHRITADFNGINNEYKIEGRKIRTNQDTSINILYIKSSVAEAFFDADFVRVLALQLALDAFTALAGRGASRTKLENELIVAISEAKLNGSLEELSDEAYSTDWEDSRVV